MSKKGREIPREIQFDNFKQFEEWRAKQGDDIIVKEVEFDRTDLNKRVDVKFKINWRKK